MDKCNCQIVVVEVNYKKKERCLKKLPESTFLRIQTTINRDSTSTSHNTHKTLQTWQNYALHPRLSP